MGNARLCEDGIDGLAVVAVADSTFVMHYERLNEPASIRKQ